MKKLNISTYTDESGQDTKGKLFVVCTIITTSDKAQEIEDKLKEIEKISNKTLKWYHSGNLRRHNFITKLLFDKSILRDSIVYYSMYQNKKDYTALVGSHIAKAILSYTKDKEYTSKIFIDKMNKKTLENIKEEIKLFRIRYKKIRGVDDKSSALIRLADAICGVIRDLDTKSRAENYQILFNKLKEV